MKLHYSQTANYKKTFKPIVLLPYEITLFSNSESGSDCIVIVLLPYEITLFSNLKTVTKNCNSVLLPYEITLFSNQGLKIA